MDLKNKAFLPVPDETERIAKRVLDAAFKVHSALGPGLLESVYEQCLAYELRKDNLFVETQVSMPIIYEDMHIDSGLRLDMLVEKCVIVEIKAVGLMNPLFESQILTYLKLTKTRLGLLINFNVVRLKEGIKRFVI
jgi:GxxExxY protein